MKMRETQVMIPPQPAPVTNSIYNLVKMQANTIPMKLRTVEQAKQQQHLLEAITSVSVVKQDQTPNTLPN